MDRQRTLFLIEVALFTALAFILDNVPFLKFKIGEWRFYITRDDTDFSYRF
ncbi:hypothetical protein [Paracerasibacillus soli]|uniref:DUF2809 domain-containing protein n=1 Tax=Paracerasibacillus soli TaxID=480284 RepID=A0ABU5CRE4_9BACI|nr:hypothetical protein [Virgibacillus soli]MDY0408025.1 hypothetical protein [Virgibacillus soli]